MVLTSDLAEGTPSLGPSFVLSAAFGFFSSVFSFDSVFSPAATALPPSALSFLLSFFCSALDSFSSDASDSRGRFFESAFLEDAGSSS